MRKLSEALRLKASGLSNRQIASSCGVARSTVGEYLRRAREAGLVWPLPGDLSEEDLERRLFGGPATRGRDTDRPAPDFQRIHKELSRRGVTLNLLWQEYLEEHPDGYRYSQFCERYRRWARTIDVCMRQTYRAGEKVFVDYAGMTMPVVDRSTGEVRDAQIFVGALGASHYLYSQATRTQQLPDWIGAHVHMYEYFGGVPALTVPDNTRVAVSKACRYEPEPNPTYQDMASHHGTAILPARPRKPRDKAKVESGVQIVEREILAPLRDHTFFSLAELNDAIWKKLAAVNRRPLQKMGVCRFDLFLELDRPALQPLPSGRYEYAEFRLARVNIDYHIEVLGHYYSVPFRLRGQQVDVRMTARIVEALHKGRRVASHVRDDRKGYHTTDPSHMPKAHQAHLKWTPSRLIQWAGKIGPYCAETVRHIIQSRPHPEQGYRACLGLLRLSTGYEKERLEAACRRAVLLDTCSYQSVKSILKTGKDREDLPVQPIGLPGCTRTHENVRGGSYYQQAGETEVGT